MPARITSTSLNTGEMSGFRLFSCFPSALRMALLMKVEDRPIERIMELPAVGITQKCDDHSNCSAGVYQALGIHQISQMIHSWQTSI